MENISSTFYTTVLKVFDQKLKLIWNWNYFSHWTSLLTEINLWIIANWVLPYFMIANKNNGKK